MTRFVFIFVLFFMANIYAQKKYNFGLTAGSEQFYESNKGNSPMKYELKNARSTKFGIFVEKNLKNNDEILIGLNYSSYWNDFTYLNGTDIWVSGMKNTLYDIDIHYNHLITKRVKVFFGSNVSFYRFHDKYEGNWYLDNGVLYARELNDVTDFNVAFNTGVKYVINPSSKIKLEPFVLIGATLFRRDNFKVDYPTEEVASNHYYKHIYTRFGLNIKY